VVVYKHFYLFPSNQITTRKTAHIYLYEHSLTQRVAVGGTVWLSNETETIFSAGPPTNSVVPPLPCSTAALLSEVLVQL
jgi:hypothetical protein